MYAPYLHARNNIIEFNHVERTMLKLSDGSSINISGAGLGNIVRNNYLYDIPFVGIRMDDWQDGTLVENNILHKVAERAIILKGVNVLKNNIMINCEQGISFKAYPKIYFEAEGVEIKQNIFYSDRASFMPFNVSKWGKGSIERSTKAGVKPRPYEYDMDYNCYSWSGAEADLKVHQKNGIEAHGVIMDPKFVNIDKRDYRITNKRLIDAIGFKPFDVSLDNFGVTDQYPTRYKNKDLTLR